MLLLVFTEEDQVLDVPALYSPISNRCLDTLLVIVYCYLNNFLFVLLLVLLEEDQVLDVPALHSQTSHSAGHIIISIFFFFIVNVIAYRRGPGVGCPSSTKSQ